MEREPDEEDNRGLTVAGVRGSDIFTFNLIYPLRVPLTKFVATYLNANLQLALI